MKTCANCNEEFNSSTVIDGEKRSLTKRKYCLDCVPYGDRTMYRGKKVVPGSRYKEKEFICITCGKKKKNKTRNKECGACRCTKIRLDRKTQAVSEKGGKCIVCGYNRYNGALEFHHLGKQKKEETLGKMWLLSPKRIKKELAKCILVCSCCHREIHGNIISL